MSADEPGGSGEEGCSHRVSLQDVSGCEMVPRRARSLQDLGGWPSLTRPDVRFRASFLAAMEEFREEGRAGEDTMIGWDLDPFGDTLGDRGGFRGVRRETAEAEHRPGSPGFVCQTSWWWTEGDEYVGRISLRHELNDRLRDWGGHIGYDVRRSRRREGHATRMLGRRARRGCALGASTTSLLTCDAGNVASRSVIETNGGVLEDQAATQAALLGADDPRLSG